MPNNVITFGQRGGYFFECTSARYANRLRQALLDLFKDNGVTNTYCAALGAGDCYLISYKGSDDMLHLQSAGIPNSLREWLYEKDSSGSLSRQLSSLKVNLGPYNDSYFASDGQSFRWLNLPSSLKDAIEQRRAPGGGWTDGGEPRVVSLGYGDNYVLLTEGHGGSWKLNQYPALDGCIDTLQENESGLSFVKNIALNPYRIDSFAVELTNGAIIWNNNMPHAVEDAEKFEEANKKDVKEEAEARKLKAQLQAMENAAAAARQRAQLNAQIAQQQRLQASLLQLQMQQQLNLQSQALFMNSMMSAFNNFNF